MVVGDILKRQARINAKKIALVDGDKQFTYKEFNERVNRLANALIKCGLNKGEKVAFMANNCHELAEGYFAVAKAGLIMVPINARFRADEIAYTLNHVESNVLIYQEQLRTIIKQASPTLKTINQVFVIGHVNDDKNEYEQLIKENSPDEPDVPVNREDIAMIMYTSGATGTPKGVIMNHRNLLATTNTQTLDLRIVPEDINLLVMPMFHAGGLWPLLAHAYRGAKTIILPRFDEENVLQMIEKERITFLNLVPTTLRRIAIRPDLRKYDLSSLRVLMYAGAPIPLHQLKEAMHILGPHRFFTGLGATEAGCGGILSFSTHEHALALDGPLADKLGSVGRDAMNMEVRIVDEQGKELSPGQVGEIVVRGDEIAVGYWKMPEDTATTFKDGWLHNGDLGYRDEDGYVFIVGRKKDIIISGGENISSVEVEDAVSQHPAVAEVAVIGVPDEEWGEAVKAVVALKLDFKDKITEADLMEFCRPKLAGYKRPRSIDFVGELPKNVVGKIDKASLKQYYKNLYEERGIKSALG